MSDESAGRWTDTAGQSALRSVSVERGSSTRCQTPADAARIAGC